MDFIFNVTPATVEFTLPQTPQPSEPTSTPLEGDMPVIPDPFIPSKRPGDDLDDQAYV